MRSKFIILFCSFIPMLTTAQTAEQIVKNYFTSIGGIETLRNFKSSSGKSLLIQRFGKTDTTLVVESTKAPESFHRSVYKQGRLTSEVYGSAEGVTTLLYKPYFNQIFNPRTKVHLTTAHELLLAYDKRKIKRQADTTIHNQETYVIKTRLSKKDSPLNKKYYFEKKTGYLIASSSENIANDFVLYENYSSQDGLLLPMQLTHLLAGKILFELQVQSLEINPPLHDSLFVAKQHALASQPAFRLSKRVEYLDQTLADADLNVFTQPFRGKLVLIDLWASWCGPCKDEFAKYDDAFHHYLKSNNIEMVYLSFDKLEKEADWRKVIDQFSLNGYHARAEKKLKQSIQQNIFEGGQMYVPRLILLGKNGEVLSSEIPNLSSGFFYTKLEELVKSSLTP